MSTTRTAIGRAWGLALLVAASAAGPVFAEEASSLGARMLQDPKVTAALEHAKRTEPTTLEDQVRLCEVPAPPFQETRRGEVYRAAFEQIGLKNVRVDAVGNVIGERPGRSPRPHLVLSAHLDTVFPEGTDVRVKREGPILRGPGIGDDCRGLTVVLAVARALAAAGVETEGSISFVGTVGEEGLGDLRGVKHLFNQELKGKIDRFISVDGTGLGLTHVGVGSHRYRVTFSGPGGHSFGAFGMANPIHALGRALAAIADFQVPANPKTTFNVGRVGGGTSINSIPFEAWAEIDMRSADKASLDAVDAAFQQAVDRALADENRRWGGRGAVTVKKEMVGLRPPGRTDRDSPLVQAAISVTRALGLPVVLDEGSTDSNVPMGLGIPAVTIDGGGKGTGAHSPNESFDSTDSWQGTVRAVLLTLALSRAELR